MDRLTDNDINKATMINVNGTKLDTDNGSTRSKQRKNSTRNRNIKHGQSLNLSNDQQIAKKKLRPKVVFDFAMLVLFVSMLMPLVFIILETN